MARYAARHVAHLLLGSATAALLTTAPGVRAAPVTFVASLSGVNEIPQIATSGSGSVVVTIDSVTNLMTLVASFSGLTSNDTAAHIHCCIAQPGNTGVATALPALPGFPLGVTSGTYAMTLDMTLASNYNPAFITANGGTAATAETALFTGIQAGQTYFNIHTVNNPGGEIRGILMPAPEPGTAVLSAAGLGFLALLFRRRNRQA